jgi:hypothetical protein
MAAARERSEFVALGFTASRDERHAQLAALNEKVDRNIEVNQAAITTAGEAVTLANKTNLKIQQLREDFQTSQSSTSSPASGPASA